MPWRRYLAHKIGDKRYVIIDTHTGSEATVDGDLFGEMGGTHAHFGAELLNWLDANPAIPTDAWTIEDE